MIHSAASVGDKKNMRIIVTGSNKKTSLVVGFTVCAMKHLLLLESLKRIFSLLERKQHIYISASR